jgi:GH25 family lysozyme M1 (1,4-beta-N-acetylmuramidase)
MANEVLGIDVSRWQGEIEWLRVAQAGYQYAVIRATVGDYYTDPKFDVNWRDAQEAGLFVTAYHVTVPGRAPAAQIDRFFKVLGNRDADLPLVLDVELNRKPGTTQIFGPAAISDNVLRCADLCEQGDERRPIIYTAAWFWNANISRSAQWATYPLWVASYGGSQPRMPVDWRTWTFWQKSNAGRVPGVSSQNVDINTFNGSLDDFMRMVARPEPDGEDTGVAPPSRLGGVVKARALNIRKGPSANFEIVGRLKAGDGFEVFDVDGRDAWVQIGPDRWIAVKVNGSEYADIEP